MTTGSRFAFADIWKMGLSAGWIALVAVVTQNFMVQRSDARPGDNLTRRAPQIQERVRGFRDGRFGPADSRLVLAQDAPTVVPLPSDGVLLIASGASNAYAAAGAVDDAVKTYGVERVGIATELNERFGFDLTVELLRRGYRDGELLQLMGGNSARLAVNPAR